MIAELKGARAKNDRGLSDTVDKLKSGMEVLNTSLTRHRLENQSNLLKHKKNVDQIERELKEAFDVLWPKIESFEKSIKDFPKYDDSKIIEKTKEHGKLLLEHAEQIAELSKTIEKRYQNALKKINQQKDKVEIRIDNGEVKLVRDEIARLEKLIKDTAKYEYGSSLNVLNAAVPVGFTGALNFKSGFTIALNPAGYIDIVANGGGFTTIAATETPNGSTTVFTFSTAAAQPSYIVSDNVWLKPTSKAGTTNWTWNAGTKKATLTIPPTDDIWGVV
jgi:hypothetical protein